MEKAPPGRVSGGAFCCDAGATGQRWPAVRIEVQRVCRSGAVEAGSLCEESGVLVHSVSLLSVRFSLTSDSEFVAEHFSFCHHLL